MRVGAKGRRDRSGGPPSWRGPPRSTKAKRHELGARCFEAKIVCNTPRLGAAGEASDRDL